MGWVQVWHNEAIRGNYSILLIKSLNQILILSMALSQTTCIYHYANSVVHIKHDFLLKTAIVWQNIFMYEENILVILNLCIWDESGPLICPPPYACSSDSLGRNHHVWPYSGGTLDENLKKDTLILVSLNLGWCARCGSALKSHLYEDSTLLHRHCLKTQYCRGLQTEWKVSTSQQSEETYTQTWQ